MTAKTLPTIAAIADGAPLVIVGVDHRSSPDALREGFARVEAALDHTLEALRAAGAREAVLIATCDRVELVTIDAPAVAAFAPLLASLAGASSEMVLGALRRYEGDAALGHLFAVASALESSVIGEPHVLGQLRAAHRAAAEQGLVGPVLETAFLGAFACARRVRRETAIAERPQSIASSAIELARGIHGDLARLAVLLIGPSEMGEHMAEAFRQAGLSRLVVCGAAERAERAARRLGANHASLDELEVALAAADITIAAQGSGRTILTPSLLSATMRKRPLRPIFVIDAAVPADADPAINALDGVFLYDLADLERATLKGRAGQTEAAEAARRIVAEELVSFRERVKARRAVPIVVALRAHFESVRAEVMAEHGLDAEEATRRLVNRLLHAPSAALRDLVGREGDAEAIEGMLRRLFRLGQEEDEA